MAFVLERPCPVLDTPESTAVQAILDGAYGARIFVVVVGLPLVVELADKEVRGEEVS